MNSTPAVAIEAILSGLKAIGIPVHEIQKKLKLKKKSFDPQERVPLDTSEKVWELAIQYDPRPELPTLAALNIPFGAFGALDYLAGTCNTVRGGMQALSDHFAAISKETRLDVFLPNKRSGTLRLIRKTQQSPRDWISDEFTTSVIIGRFKGRSSFTPSCIYLTRPHLAGKIHECIFGVPVAYSATTAGFDIDKDILDLHIQTADLHLHQFLLEVSKKLNLGSADDLEILIRSRLRDLLPQGVSSADRVARSLGFSERTFHRKLKDINHTFQEVLDRFRIEESERLLVEGKVDLNQIALELGYSNQSTWSRFFRRVRGRTATQWLYHKT